MMKHLKQKKNAIGTKNIHYGVEPESTVYAEQPKPLIWREECEIDAEKGEPIQHTHL